MFWVSYGPMWTFFFKNRVWFGVTPPQFGKSPDLLLDFFCETFPKIKRWIISLRGLAEATVLDHSLLHPLCRTYHWVCRHHHLHCSRWSQFLSCSYLFILTLTHLKCGLTTIPRCELNWESESGLSSQPLLSLLRHLVFCKRDLQKHG